MLASFKLAKTSQDHLAGGQSGTAAARLPGADAAREPLNRTNVARGAAEVCTQRLALRF